MFTAAFAHPTLEGGVQHGIYLPGLQIAAVCLVLLLLVALPGIASWRRARGRHVLNPAAVESLLLGAGALVVDLREAKDFRTGHIRGCLQVPFADLSTQLLAPDPKATRSLILVDETDALSHRAYDLLVRRGFGGIFVMKGGMRAWRRASRPVAK
ncbi:MAG TPA: rhodanese-like domain-containing protein [Geothrix sp.]